tara:strand:- start:3614 stop:5422 length:1809 start_codon:yes stop_codon:yes gene_type:complete
VTRILLVFLSFFLSLSALSNNLQTLQVAGDDYYAHSFPLQMYVDYSSALTIDDISKLDLSDKVGSARFNIPVERANYWFVFEVQNQSSKDIERIIKFDEALLHQADIYYQQPSNALTDQKNWFSEKSGLVVPIMGRGINNRLPSFNITLKAGEKKRLYLMANFKLNMLTIGLEIKSPNKFLTDEQLEIAAYCLFFGLSLAMLIYNFFLLIVLHDKLYFYYVAYCSTFLIFVVVYSGFNLYIFDALFWVYFFISSVSISVVFLFQFVRELLQTKHHMPRADFVLRLIMLLFIMQAILTSIDTYYHYLLIYLAIPCKLFLFLVNLWAYFKKIPLANYSLFGLSCYLLGTFTIVGVNAGFLPFNFFTRYGFMFGSMIELFVFSLALAYRVRYLQVNKTEMQLQLYLTESKAKQALKETVKSRTGELEALNKKLQHLSQEDGLTGLFNRRYFDHAIAKEWERMKRQKSPLCVVLADLDFFKEFNDLYGHQHGDHCLRITSGIIKQVTNRSADIAARYGGEEFVLLLPESESQDGLKIAHKIQKVLKEKKIEHEFNIGGLVTISFGIAATVPSDNNSIEMLIKQADVALYESKKNGRNCITIHELGV